MNILFLMNKTKDQISWVSSHDLYRENKMYKRKRSIAISIHAVYISIKLSYTVATSSENGIIYFFISY